MSVKLIGVLLMASVCVLRIFPIAHAAQGNAVFYNPPYTPSACYQMRNPGVFLAGVRDELWGNGAACGRRYFVRCVGSINRNPRACKYGRSVVVTVADYCRPPCNGVINLSLDAFSVIAFPEAGNVKIEYYPI